MGIIVSLLNKSKLLSLRLIKAACRRMINIFHIESGIKLTLDRVGFLQLFQGKDQELRVMLI